MLAAQHACQRAFAVVGNLDPEAGIAEEFFGNLLVDFIVFDQQDMGAGNAAELLGQRTVIAVGGFLDRRQGVAGAQAARCGFQQQGSRDRLDQYIANAGVLRGFQHFLVAKGGDHDHVRRLGQPEHGDAPGYVNAVHAGHLPVQEDDFIGVGARLGFGQCGERGGAITDRFHGQAQLIEHVLQHQSRVFVIVHHQHATAVQVGPGCHLRQA